MTNLLCPDCGAALDLFTGVVDRQRTYPLSLERGAPLVVDRVARTTQVLTCGRCEWADTVANVLKAGAR